MLSEKELTQINELNRKYAPQSYDSLKKNYEDYQRNNQSQTRTGFLNNLISIVSRGNYASANVMLDLVNKGEFRPLKSAWEGFTGKNETMYADVLKEMGVENKAIRTIGGFAGDILLDPTTWIGIGALSKAIKVGGTLTKTGMVGGKILNKAGVGLYKEILEKSGEEIAQRSMARLVAKTGEEYVAKKAVKEGITFMGKTIVRPEWLGKIGDVTGLTNVAKMAEESKMGQWFGKSFIPDFKPAYISQHDWNRIIKIRDSLNYAKKIGDENVLLRAKRMAEDIPLAVDREKIVQAVIDAKRTAKQTGASFGDVLKDILPDEKLSKWAQEVGSDYVKIIDENLERGWKTVARDGYFAVTHPEKMKKGFFPKHWEQKVYKTPQEAKTAGGIIDPLYAWSQRMFDHNRLTAGREAMENIRTTFGKPLLEGGKLSPDFSRGTIPALSNYQFPSELVRDIERVFRNTEEKAFKGFLGGYDRVLNFWKGSVTSIFPSFHARNLMSNTWNMHLAGVNLLKLVPKTIEARSFQKYVFALEKGNSKVIKELAGKKIGKYTFAELKDWVSKTDVINLGWFGQEMSPLGFHKNLQSALREGVVQKAIHPMETGRKLGNAIENNSKLVLFFDRIKKGDDIIDAANTTKKYLFDYRRLTSAEKGILKRVFPFYSWMKFNIPLQFEQLLKQPGKYVALEKVRNNIEAIDPDANPVDKYMPDWMKRQYTIKTPFEIEDKPLIFAPDLAFQDLARGTTLAHWVASISPFLKAPLEYAANYDFFRRRTLVNPDLPPNIANWTKAKKIIINNIRAESFFVKLSTDDRTLLEKFLNDIVGMNVYRYDQKAAKRIWSLTEKKQKRAIQREKQLKKKMGGVKYFLGTPKRTKFIWEEEE